MYSHVGLRASLIGAGTSGVAGAVGVHSSLPAPLRLLLVVTSGGLTLYLSATVTLLVLAVAFRLHATRDAARHPAAPLGRADAQPGLSLVPPTSP
jgi:hypothetical protein